jgi:hypothetical protein
MSPIRKLEQDLWTCDECTRRRVRFGSREMALQHVRHEHPDAWAQYARKGLLGWYLRGKSTAPLTESELTAELLNRPGTHPDTRAELLRRMADGDPSSQWVQGARLPVKVTSRVIFGRSRRPQG